MDSYGRFYSRHMMPFWEGVVRRRPTMSYWSSLEAMQWGSPEQIEAWRLGQLRELLLHAGTRIPYYRELFQRLGFDPGAVRSIEALSRLPVLTREIIRERYRDLVDPATASSHIHKRTGGSTGVPLVFEYDVGSEVWRQAVKWRSYGWAGCRPGVRTLHYWGVPTEARGARKWKIRTDRFLRRERYIDCLAQDPTSLAHAVAAIREYRPSVVVGYTLATATLARFMIQHGLRSTVPINVLVGAESLVPEDRQTIAEAFGGSVHETYGSRETMLIAAECEAHAGLHTMDDSLIVEILADAANARPGETGDVVVTDLHNYGMPLIRYRNGDLAAAASGPCPCGRGLGRLERVVGRRIDTMRAADGTPVPGMLVCALLATMRHQVREYQVVQDRTGAVVVRIVRGDHYEPESNEALVANIRRYLRGQPVTVDFTDHIDRTQSGKHRPVVVENAAPTLVLVDSPLAGMRRGSERSITSAVESRSTQS